MVRLYSQNANEADNGSIIWPKHKCSIRRFDYMAKTLTELKTVRLYDQNAN
jgi:hypothetical protein